VRGVVLSIGKLGRGQENYYLETVAKGAEDYYVGRGEAPGRWLGTVTSELGLDGRVNAEDLRQVLAGVGPSSGERFARGGEHRVPGFDLTFCAPKSVSVLWGLGDRDISAAARTAHDSSVDAALRYLEDQACWSRRGTNGFVKMPGDGFVAAAFRHRTSRAGDPHLHTHVVVSNATRSTDGRWGALDARHLYLHAKTAGYLYEAQLRAELTRRLGVAWTPVVNGIADVDGIPPAVLERFSTRRHEIEAEMAERGVSSARAAQFAVLETRQAKDYSVEPSLLRTRWTEQVSETGWSADELAAVLGRAPARLLTEERAGIITDRLLGPAGLTKQASTFDRRAVLRAWCEQLTDGADVMLIERLADQTLADPRVVPLRSSEHGPVGTMRRRTNGRPMDTPTTGSRYSTQELIALETCLVQRAATGADESRGVADENSVLAALSARPSLSDEQVEMIATLTTSGRSVDVVIAAAGTGKTFSLDAARDAWQRSGYLVIGTALAARAAAELEATAGIESHTVTGLLADLDQSEHGGLRRNTVLVIDEAGMVGTRLLARVLDHAEAAHAKVVLVGDPRQLPEIDAGGLLRGLGRRIPTIRLTENRRQHEAWERAALTQLRHGDVDEAIAAYQQHGRICANETAPAARDAMTADWWAATVAGERALMLATRWSDVDDLNARARARLVDGGMLTGASLTIDERPYQAGDRIMTLSNDRRLAVRNGMCAVVTAVDPEQRGMTVRTDAGIAVALPARYLDDGHIRHAYATTIHKAQGQTVDRAFVLGSDTLYQEAGYVALSRGRAENRIYVVGSEPRPEAHAPEARPPGPVEALTHSLKATRAQQLAVDAGIDRSAIRRDLDALVQERDFIQAVTNGCPRSQRYEIDALATKREDNASLLAKLRQELVALDEKRGWRQGADRQARRIVLNTTISFRAGAVDDLDRALVRARDAQQQHDAYALEHMDVVARRSGVDAAFDARFSQLIDTNVAEPPSYLHALGKPPADPTQLAKWREAAAFVERLRIEHGITDPQEPFGRQPSARLNSSHQMDERHLAGLVVEIHGPAHGRDLGVEL
jgi:conjugative relaxase-like TrwC/TraI family protein